LIVEISPLHSLTLSVANLGSMITPDFVNLLPELWLTPD
jgi:hypothetical protein